MKKYCLFLLTLITILSSFTALKAQPPAYHYTPVTPHIQFPQNYYYGRSATISQKHHFTIAFTDGRDTTLYTKLLGDSSSFYLQMENKSVGKKDSGRFIKVFPSQTKYISHLDPTTGKDYVGMASDSCWLFKVIAGKMNAYTDLAEISVDDEFIRYIQVGDGPMVAITDPNAGNLFSSNERALELFTSKKYNRAVKIYNKTGN